MDARRRSFYRRAVGLRRSIGIITALVLTTCGAVARAEVARGEQKTVLPGKSAELPQFSNLSSSRFDVQTPRLPAPLSMPELAHPDPNLGVEWTVGLGAPSAAGRTASAIGLLRIAGEIDVVKRRLYLGGTYPAAVALPPSSDGPSKFVLGNVEAHIRVTFPQPTWLAFGATLGVIAPTARFGRNGAAQDAALAAISFDPTDVSYFMPGAVVLRPAYDVRVIRGPFVAQARQGLDIALDGAGLRQATTNGRLLLHFGVLALRNLEASLEFTQLYRFGTEVPDGRRNAMTIGPSIRWMLGKVDLGTGVVTNVLSPLNQGLDQLVGLRLSVIGHFH